MTGFRDKQSLIQLINYSGKFCDWQGLDLGETFFFATFHEDLTIKGAPVSLFRMKKRLLHIRSRRQRDDYYVTKLLFGKSNQSINIFNSSTIL